MHASIWRFAGVPDELLRRYDAMVAEIPRANLLLHFRGGRRTFPYVSASQILSGRLAAGSLRDKIHNPFDWTCNCDASCWCRTSRLGRAVMWYVPPRFHRFPPKSKT